MSSGSNPPRGGTSAKKTPANNVGGGSGLGDPGYPKGGSPTTGQFSALGDRRRIERERDEHAETEPNTTQDSSFMARKPGHPETLPGWDKLKDATGYNG